MQSILEKEKRELRPVRNGRSQGPAPANRGRSLPLHGSRSPPGVPHLAGGREGGLPRRSSGTRAHPPAPGSRSHHTRPGPQPHTSPQPPPQMAEPGLTLIPGAPAPSSGLPGNWARTAPAKPLPALRRWVLFAERTRVQRHPGRPALRIAREPGQVVPTPPWPVPVKGPDSWGDFVGLETAG